MRQVRDEGVTGSSAYILTTSEVQQSQRGEPLHVGQAAIRQLTTAWTQTHTHTHRCQELLSPTLTMQLLSNQDTKHLNFPVQMLYVSWKNGP